MQRIFWVIFRIIAPSIVFFLFFYIWYYFDIQLRQIFMYWVLGMVIGSLVSVFAKDRIHKLFASMQGTGIGTVGIFLASALGIRCH